MPLMWQYQQLAELPPARRLEGDWQERPDPAKFGPVLPTVYFPDVRFQKALLPAIRTHISTAAPLSEMVWKFTMDKWASKLPDIQFRARYLSKAIQPNISTEPRMAASVNHGWGWNETVDPEKYGPYLPARRYERAYLTAAVLSYPTYTEEIWRYGGRASLTFIMAKTKTRF